MANALNSSMTTAKVAVCVSRSVLLSLVAIGIILVLKEFLVDSEIGNTTYGHVVLAAG